MGQILIEAALNMSQGACKVAEPRKLWGSFLISMKQAPESALKILKMEKKKSLGEK